MDEFEDDKLEIAQRLVRAARKAKDNSFAPYSGFSVGAALETDKGLYTGANVEVSGRSTSVHAEMLAAFKAVTDGAQKFQYMAISAGDDPDGKIAPCGLCQHTLSQFTSELEIFEDAGNGETPRRYWLSELIGEGYSASTRHFDKIGDSS